MGEAPAPDWLVEQIARLCHEANRVWCQIGDDLSHPRWESTHEILRESVRDGVRWLIAHPDATPEGAHNRWCEYKLAEGWRYGGTKDLVARRHPNLVPFAQLPWTEQQKNAIFHSIVRLFSRGAQG